MERIGKAFAFKALGLAYLVRIRYWGRQGMRVPLFDIFAAVCDDREMRLIKVALSNPPYRDSRLQVAAIVMWSMRPIVESILHACTTKAPLIAGTS